jgi:hypothetical protein
VEYTVALSAMEDIAMDKIPEFRPVGKEDMLAKKVFLSLVYCSSVCSVEYNSSVCNGGYSHG